MKQELFIDNIPGECRIALMEDDVIVEVDIDRSSSQSQIGNIYWGRADSVVPSLQAAFLTLDNGPQGFLSVREANTLYPQDGNGRPRIETIIHEGQWVLVQVSKDTVGDKGPRLTANPSMAGRFLVYQPMKDGIAISSRIRDEAERARLTEAMQEVINKVEAEGGFIIRTVAEGADIDVLVHEAESLASQWNGVDTNPPTGGDPVCVHRDLEPRERALRDWAMPEIAKITTEGRELFAATKKYTDTNMPDLSERLVGHTGSELLFEEAGIEAAIDEALETRMDLSTGGWLSIEPTEALTAIDVNSGGFKQEGDREQIALKTNLAAVPVIARQLRLRDMGGQIVIDFINMRDQAHRTEVGDAMDAALQRDKAPTQILGWTRLGLMELTRRRTRKSLPDFLTGERRLQSTRVRSVESTGYDILRLAHLEADCTPTGTVKIGAHKSVVGWLNGGPLARLSSHLGRTMESAPEEDMAIDEFDIYSE
jgi:ribonuclease G